jgi:integrase
MEQLFDIVKQARALLKTLPLSTANAKTKAGYERTMRRLFEESRTVTALIDAAQQTQKVSTWFSRKAAITHTTRGLIERLLAQQDQTQRALRGVPPDDANWLSWRAQVRELGNWCELLKRIHIAPAIPKAGRKNRHSKRLDMRALPQDWRQKLIKRLPNYAPAVLVAAVTGCRPDELVTGVEVWIDNGLLVAVIKGSKHTEKSGQEWRRLSWSLETDSSLVQELIQQIRLAGGNKTIHIKSATNFSSAVRNAGKREWPRRDAAITPYCFRHQCAADMKAAGWLSDADISAALGHCSDVTKSTYGHYRMGRKTGGVAPKTVTAARPVQIKQTSGRRLARDGTTRSERFLKAKIGRQGSNI